MHDLPALLTRLDRPGYHLIESSRGLRLRRPRLADAELIASVHRHAAALRVAHRLDRIDPLDTPARRDAWGVNAWGPETALHARWMALLFEPPQEPFTLHPGHRIADWDRFRSSVAQRYAAGPDGPYADDLRRDLAALFERFAAPVALGARPRTARARAA